MPLSGRAERVATKILYQQESIHKVFWVTEPGAIIPPLRAVKSDEEPAGYGYARLRLTRSGVICRHP